MAVMSIVFVAGDAQTRHNSFTTNTCATATVDDAVGGQDSVVRVLARDLAWTRAR